MTAVEDGPWWYYLGLLVLPCLSLLKSGARSWVSRSWLTSWRWALTFRKRRRQSAAFSAAARDFELDDPLAAFFQSGVEVIEFRLDASLGRATPRLTHTETGVRVTVATLEGPCVYAAIRAVCSSASLRLAVVDRFGDDSPEIHALRWQRAKAIVEHGFPHLKRLLRLEYDELRKNRDFRQCDKKWKSLGQRLTTMHTDLEPTLKFILLREFSKTEA